MRSQEEPGEGAGLPAGRRHYIATQSWHHEPPDASGCPAGRPRYNPAMLLPLRTVGWLACVVYSTIPAFWLMIHSRAASWRRRSSPYRILVPAWVVMWIVLGAITAPWRNLVLYSSPWSWIPAVALFAAGFWVYFQARRQFSLRQLGGLPEIVPRHPEQRLVISGIRSRVRHPVYLGHLCELLAWSVGTGLAVCYLLTVLALATGAVMIRHEEAELEQRFGEEYREYRKKVPSLLPRVVQGKAI
ncbi:MAG TPA: isoprenylcysteine carboxylmethyltransferase family protein [Terriglobales bacterium]|nr:isoprenylcysteine carboxylmethyltransferase family protein [Terriglobales bacterium]